MAETRYTQVTTSARAAADIQATWNHLDGLYRADPTVRKVAGARAAAEWTLQLAQVAPISGARVPARLGGVIDDEAHQAGMTVEGILPGDREYALGAEVWLFWWIGLEPLPKWLRP